MANVERPPDKGFNEAIYDLLFRNYVWQSIFRTGYPNTPRNQMLVVATNVFLHLHPTRIHRTHVKITHTYCLGGVSFFMFLGLTVTGVLLMFYYVPSVERAYQDIQALETNVRFGQLLRNLHRWMAHAMIILVLAWSLGAVTNALETAAYISQLLSGAMPVFLLPASVFVVSALVAFATGTSWTTMAILVPLVVPLSITMTGGLDLAAGGPERAVELSTVVSVLAGAFNAPKALPSLILRLYLKSKIGSSATG